MKHLLFRFFVVYVQSRRWGGGEGVKMMRKTQMVNSTPYLLPDVGAKAEAIGSGFGEVPWELHNGKKRRSTRARRTKRERTGNDFFFTERLSVGSCQRLTFVRDL